MGYMPIPRPIAVPKKDEIMAGSWGWCQSQVMMARSMVRKEVQGPCSTSPGLLGSGLEAQGHLASVSLLCPRPQVLHQDVFVFVFCFFRAAPTAYGGSQASGQIGATAAGLHHSHSNARALTHWVEARDRTCVLMDTSQIPFCCAMMGTLRMLSSNPSSCDLVWKQEPGRWWG